MTRCGTSYCSDGVSGEPFWLKFTHITLPYVFILFKMDNTNNGVPAHADAQEVGSTPKSSKVTGKTMGQPSLPNSGNASLPSPAVTSSSNAGAKARGSNQPSKSATAKAAASPGGAAGPAFPRANRKGKGKPPAGGNGNPKPKNGNKAAGSQQLNKRRDLAQSIASEINTYRLTQVYRDALSKTFATKAALDAFNTWANNNIDNIDPSAIVVCCDCGHAELTLCDCWITAAPNAVPAPTPGVVLAIPSGPANIRWRFGWVDRVRRMFAWPSYNPDTPVNHQIGWMSNSALQEGDLLVPEMLAYIRLHQNTSYKIDGVFDRGAKLAHSKKLALRYLDEQKVPLGERTSSRFVACLHHTIQKAADNEDDDFLLQENNEGHNIYSYFRKAPVRYTTVVLAAAVLSPLLTARLVGAKMSVMSWIYRRLITANAQTMVHGSVLVARSVIHTFSAIGTAVKEHIWNGIFQPYFTGIQQSLCNTARTMWWTALRIDISRRLPNLSLALTSASGVMAYLSQLFGACQQTVMRVLGVVSARVSTTNIPGPTVVVSSAVSLYHRAPLDLRVPSWAFFSG